MEGGNFKGIIGDTSGAEDEGVVEGGHGDGL